MKTSFKPNDVILLLNEIINPKEYSLEERESIMQNGGHYSNFLPKEHLPEKEYIKIFKESLKKNRNLIAELVKKVSLDILNTYGTDIVLVSLIRGGTPHGVLIKRFLNKYGVKAKHYGISIIRDIGLDHKAITEIINYNPNKKIIFVDGWTAKGTIKKELTKSCKNYKIEPILAVLSDANGYADISGTKEDILIPNCLLNSTVSGLISRTLFSQNNYHQAKYYEEFEDHDLTNYFLDKISECFKSDTDLEIIQKKYNISNINLIKPGIGETMRVILRRVPERILISKNLDSNANIVIDLAKSKGIKIEKVSFLTKYKTVAIIKNKGDL